MISASAALKAHLAQQYQTIATCLKVVRTDGVTLGFTDNVQDIVFAGLTYEAAVTYTRTDINTQSDLSRDQVQVAGMLESPAITDDALHAGAWDYAYYELFLVNWADLTMGRAILRAGWLGEVDEGAFTFNAECAGLATALTRVIGELDGPACRADLGDARCKVRLAAPTWTALTLYGAVVVGDASLGSIVAPTTYNGRVFRCTTAGTSGGSEPAWNTTVDGTTADGGVTWTTAYALTVQGALTGVNTDRVTFYDSSLDMPGPIAGPAITNVTNQNPGRVYCDVSTLSNGQPISISGVIGPDLVNTITIVRNITGGAYFELGIDTSDTSVYPPYVSGGVVTPLGATSGFFDGGKMTMTSGDGIGLSMEVRSYVPGQWTVYLPFPLFAPKAIKVGDTYTMTAGCDKSQVTCRDRFANIFNARAEYFLPGIDKLVQVGRKT